MNSVSHRSIRIAALLLVAPLFTALGVLANLLLPAVRWEAVPFHSTVEVLGAMSALMMAVFLLMMRGGRDELARYIWVAAGLIGMGLLDGFHAAVLPGYGFVWLHSTATLAGGVVFALAWLPDRCARSRWAGALPWGVALAAAVFGALSLAFRPLLPVMIIAGEFTAAAKIINLLGGLFFLAAFARFSLRYQANKTGDDLLFAGLCLIFGTAGLLFSISAIWQPDWWLWDLMRLIAYFIALGYVFMVFQRAEGQYRTVMQTSLDGFLCTDFSGRILEVNEALCQMLGYTREELLRMSIRDIEAAEAPAETAAHIQKVIRAGSDRFQTRHRRKDGALIDVEASVQCVAELGERFYAFVRDITERKRMEEKIQTSEERFRAYVEQAADALFVHDFSGRFVDVNQQACNSLGYRREELLQMTVFDVETDFDLARAQAAWSQISPNQPFTLLGHQRRKDGSMFPVEVRFGCFDQKGERLFMGLARDITERKRMESKLLESYERFDLAVKGTNDGIWDWDIRTNTNYFSPRFMELLDYGPDEVAHELATFESFLHPEDRAWVFERVRQHLEDKVPYDVEYRMRTKNGEYRWFRARGEAARDQSGKPVRMAGSVTDITELQRAEQEIRRLNANLEERVRQRTAELETANKGLEGFSYSVSHDLRTPLRAIDGFSLILLEDYSERLDDEGRRLLNVVRDNTVKMARLIDDILLFSRAGRLALALVEVDMEALAWSVWDELAPTLGTRNVKFSVGALPRACADHSALTQVLTNLLGNAAKFTRPRDPAVVEVGGSEGKDENIYYIKDNGVGFDMQYAPKLFGVFQRLHGVDEFEGSGIGLAIVKRVITKHGGRVWAEGRLNEGATFFFALPRRQPCQGDKS